MVARPGRGRGLGRRPASTRRSCSASVSAAARSGVRAPLRARPRRLRPGGRAGRAPSTSFIESTSCLSTASTTSPTCTPASGRRSAGDHLGDRRPAGRVDAVDPERAVRRVAVRAEIVGDRERGRDRHRVGHAVVADGGEDDAGHVAGAIDERAARRRPARRGRGLEQPARGRAVGDRDEAVGRRDEPAAHPRRRVARASARRRPTRCRPPAARATRPAPGRRARSGPWSIRRSGRGE